MRQSQLGGLVLVSSLLWVPVYGSYIHIVGRPVASTLGPKRRGTGQASFRDDHDLSYFTNITLGGVQVEVNVDTGRYVIVLGVDVGFSLFMIIIYQLGSLGVTSYNKRHYYR